MSTPKKARFVGARVDGAMKKRLADAMKSTGLDESDFLKTAVADFFTVNKTPEAQIAAVSRFRIAAAK